MSVFRNLLILTTAFSLQACLKRDAAAPASNGAGLGACYINQTGASPDGYLSLGQSDGTLPTTKVAQGFTVKGNTTILSTAEIWIKKIKKPGGYLLITLQQNSGGTPEGVPPFVSDDDRKKINGLPDGSPIAGGIIRLSDIPNSTNPQRISVNLDHGVTAKNQSFERTKNRSLASTATEATPITLSAGQYWLVVEFKAPANSSDYVQWGSYQNNPLKDGYALAYMENFSKRAWSIATTGVDRDMSFSIGCKND